MKTTFFNQMKLALLLLIPHLVESQVTVQHSVSTTYLNPPAAYYHGDSLVNSKFRFAKERLTPTDLSESDFKWSVIKHHLSDYFDCFHTEHVYSGLTSDVLRVGEALSVKSIEVFYSCRKYIGSVLLTPSKSAEYGDIQGQGEAESAVISVVISDDYEFVARALGVIREPSSDE